MVINVETYLKRLPRLNVKTSGLIFYRGHSSIDYELTPSGIRQDNEFHEHQVYTDIMTECAYEMSDIKYRNEIISKMQHYGVPTRLLDITTNALVALFFACEGNPRKDGAVFIIKAEREQIKLFDSDVISILSCLPRFNFEEKRRIRDLAMDYSNNGDKVDYNDQEIDFFNKEKIIRRLLHEVKKEKPSFENIIQPNHLLTHYFFQPRKSNARIIRQSGAFILFGLGESTLSIKEELQENQSNNGSYKIIIDKDSKQTILNQLSCFGISTATLYPELYKVSEHVKKKYNLQ